MFGTTFFTSKDAQDFGFKAIELARQNTLATFDFALQVLGVRTLSQAVELQSGFARKQFEAMAGKAFSENQVRSNELSSVVSDDHKQLMKRGSDVETIEALKPPVAIRESLTPDYLISLEDGKQYKSLKRHLASKGLTPAQYREKWGLPGDSPMVAPSFAARRSERAKRMGLGGKVAEVKPATTSRRSRKATEVKTAMTSGRGRKATEVKPTKPGRGRRAIEVKPTKSGRGRKAA